MITRLIVPFLDANIIDVTVTAWHKKPGDVVHPGEIVTELTTDKTTFDLESSGSGTLLAILAEPKSIVPSGYILALLGEPGEVDIEAAACNQTLMDTYRAAARQSDSRTVGRSDGQTAPPHHRPSVPPSTGAARVRATPRARRLAQEQGLDLARVQAETGAEVIDEAVLQKFLGRC